MYNNLVKVVIQEREVLRYFVKNYKLYWVGFLRSDLDEQQQYITAIIPSFVADMFYKTRKKSSEEELIRHARRLGRRMAVEEKRLC